MDSEGIESIENVTLDKLTPQGLNDIYTLFVYKIVTLDGFGSKNPKVKIIGSNLREEYRRRKCFPMLTRLPESIDEIISLRMFPRYFHDNSGVSVDPIGKFVTGEALDYWISQLRDELPYGILDNLMKHLFAIAELYRCYESVFVIYQRIRKYDVARYKSLEYDDREERITQHTMSEVSKKMNIPSRLARILVKDCWIQQYKLTGSSLLLHKCSQKFDIEMMKDVKKFEQMNYGEFASILAEHIRNKFALRSEEVRYVLFPRMDDMKTKSISYMV